MAPVRPVLPVMPVSPVRPAPIESNEVRCDGCHIAYNIMTSLEVPQQIWQAHIRQVQGELTTESQQTNLRGLWLLLGLCLRSCLSLQSDLHSQGTIN